MENVLKLVCLLKDKCLLAGGSLHFSNFAGLASLFYSGFAISEHNQRMQEHKLISTEINFFLDRQEKKLITGLSFPINL